MKTFLFFGLFFSTIIAYSQELKKKKVSYKISLCYNPIYTFSNITNSYGDYHPLKYKYPLTHTFEIAGGIERKHFDAEVYFKKGKLVPYLKFTDDLYSFLNIPFIPKNNKLMIDTFHFYNFGFRIGRIGNINKRLKYIITTGLTSEYFSESDRAYMQLYFSLDSIDTINNGYYYTQRFAGLDRFFLKKHFYFNMIFDLTIDYQLKKYLSMFFRVSYKDTFDKSSHLHLINYNFYDLKTQLEPISTGLAYSRFNQVRFGLGISYFFHKYKPVN